MADSLTRRKPIIQRPFAVLDVQADCAVITQEEIDPTKSGEFDAVAFEAAMTRIGPRKFYVADVENWLENPAAMMRCSLLFARVLGAMRAKYQDALVSCYQLPVFGYVPADNDTWISTFQSTGLLLQMTMTCPAVYFDSPFAFVSGITTVIKAALTLGLPVYAFFSPRIKAEDAWLADDQFVLGVQTIKAAGAQGVILFNETSPDAALDAKYLAMARAA